MCVCVCGGGGGGGRKGGGGGGGSYVMKGSLVTSSMVIYSKSLLGTGASIIECC